MSQTSTKNRQAAVGRPNPWVTILLLLIVVALAVLPLVINPDAEYGGADGQAGAAIGEINGSYQPWFESIWSPPSGEIESLLFALSLIHISQGIVR